MSGKNKDLTEYHANNNHIVGSEAWLSEAEVETKRRIEQLEDPNHPSNSTEAKAERKRKLDKQLGKLVKMYGDMKG